MKILIAAGVVFVVLLFIVAAVNVLGKPPKHRWRGERFDDEESS